MESERDCNTSLVSALSDLSNADTLLCKPAADLAASSKKDSQMQSVERGINGRKMAVVNPECILTRLGDGQQATHSQPVQSETIPAQTPGDAKDGDQSPEPPVPSEEAPMRGNACKSLPSPPESVSPVPLQSSDRLGKRQSEELSEQDSARGKACRLRKSGSPQFESSSAATSADGCSDVKQTNTPEDVGHGESMALDQEPLSNGVQPTPDRWCRACGTVETCYWRSGPLGTQTLCNACYFQWVKAGRPREGFSYTEYPPPPSQRRKRKSTAAPSKVASSKTGNGQPSVLKADDLCALNDAQDKPSSTGAVTVTKQLSTKRVASMKREMSKNTLSNASRNTVDKSKKKSCGASSVTKQERASHIKEGVDEEEDKENNDDDEKKQKPVLFRSKQFLCAGMYSHHFKQPSSGKIRQSSQKQTLKKSNILAAKSFHFSLPMHHGQILMEKQTDFRLPANIMEEYSLGLIGKYGARPTDMEIPSFIRIRTNIYVGKKNYKPQAPNTCQCKPPPKGGVGCGDDCLNRMMYYECDPKTCPCGDSCSNQRFQKRQCVKELQVFWTRERGWGLRTLVAIKKGQLIIEYRGEIISQEECLERMRTKYKDHKNFYFLDYHNGDAVDACTKGSEARFINHSCDPNCHIEKWTSTNKLFVGVFASKDIAPNSELFYDYNFSVFQDGGIQQFCKCGSDKCRGTIGKKSRKET